MTLAEEVLTLGVDLGKADRVVSTADEETIMVGIIPPATTQDGQEGGFTTRGHSYSPRPNKTDKPATFRLIEVRNGIPGGWGRKGQVLETDSHKGCPIMGSKLYPMVGPTVE